MKIKYDVNLMEIMKLFSNVTHAELKDCFINETMVVFIVSAGEAGKAIGKSASNVRLLENKLKKRVKIVEYSTDMLQFIRNYVSPLKVKEIKQEELGTVIMAAPDTETRAMLIGRNASSLRALEAVVQRYFSLKEIKVI